MIRPDLLGRDGCRERIREIDRDLVAGRTQASALATEYGSLMVRLAGLIEERGVIAPWVRE